MHVYVAPEAAFVTRVHGVHTSARPLESMNRPEAHELTSLSIADVQLYVASDAAPTTGVHSEHAPPLYV